MIYYFIADLTELDPYQEISIVEGVTLKKIPVERLEQLKAYIKMYHPHDKMPMFNVPSNDFDNSYYEYKIAKELPSGGISRAKRSIDDFRYFVLEDSVSDRYNMMYAKAFALADKDYFVPFSFSTSSIKNSFNELCIYNYYNELNRIDTYWITNKIRVNRPKGFTNHDNKQVVSYLKLLEDFNQIKSDFPHIDKSLEDFFLTFELSNYSTFKIVSYIACLELLLVNGSQDRLKSISGQLQTKLNLLNNQWDNPIIIENHIKGPQTLTLGKVMETIYSYRSVVAHGDFIDFSKKLNILEDLDRVDILNFVRTILKKVIIYSLQNPKLIRDLKKC
ncbi:hypothetical protein [Namhaeicola litoreus]|uniref:Apea-like HEPN domain-containing protein n=1 Tax=Namhaeicola litoreus TaxID=1052145 RepID=A0ABW3Y0B2_9FLAO